MADLVKKTNPLHLDAKLPHTGQTEGGYGGSSVSVTVSWHADDGKTRIVMGAGMGCIALDAHQEEWLINVLTEIRQQR